MKKKSFIISILSLVVLLVLFILIFKGNSNLENYKNTSVDDKDKINKIVKLLDLEHESIVIDKIEKPYRIRITLEKELKYFEYEKNANKLLYLIQDIGYVTFIYNEKAYDIEKLNSFNSIKDIDKYYSGSNFYEYDYLGTINEYKVFDKSKLCISEKQLVFTTDEYDYYLYCNNIENIYLIGKNELTLKDAISNEIVTLENINRLNITIYEEKK